MKTLKTRFYEKITAPADANGCWIWSGASDTAGYGRIKVNGRAALAHRVSYQMLADPIPEGLDLDHLCRTPACVNPEHLEPVTRAENTRRGIGPANAADRARAITHCPQNHPYTASNTGQARNGTRRCLACRREQYARIKSEAPEKYAAMRARGRATDNSRRARQRPQGN